MLTQASSNTPHFFADLLEEMQDEVFVYDSVTLGMVYANRAACTRCEWDQEAWKKKRITDSSEMFDEAAFWKHVQPLLDEEVEVVPVETVHEKGPVEIRTRLFNTPDGQRVFLSVLRDCSERKRLQSATMEAFSELSHELRTPLTSVKGAIRLLESGVLGAQPPEVQEILRVAARNTERVLSMVGDILDLQKMASGKLELDRQNLDLVKLVKNAISANSGYGWEHDVTLRLAQAPEAAMVFADQDQLMQVMANLLSNAIKHSPKSQSVDVSLVVVEQGWRVTVSDRGAGIPKDQRSRIFESFIHVTPDDGKARTGTGLGLAIAQKIVTLHGGEIGFTCREGEGTDFYFDLPVSRT